MPTAGGWDCGTLESQTFVVPPWAPAAWMTMVLKPVLHGLWNSQAPPPPEGSTRLFSAARSPSRGTPSVGTSVVPSGLP